MREASTESGPVERDSLNHWIGLPITFHLRMKKKEQVTKICALIGIPDDVQSKGTHLLFISDQMQK